MKRKKTRIFREVLSNKFVSEVDEIRDMTPKEVFHIVDNEGNKIMSCGCVSLKEGNKNE